MKEIFSIILSLLTIMLAACAQSEGPPASAHEMPTTTPSTIITDATEENIEFGTVEHDESLVDIDITLTKDFIDYYMSPFDAETYAEKMGFESVMVNTDGSVTITMSCEYHKEFLQALSVGIEDYFREIGPANNITCIHSIEHNNDFTEINIRVEKEEYEKITLWLVPFAVLMPATYYIAFTGNPSNVVINTVDADTDEILSVYDTSKIN